MSSTQQIFYNWIKFAYGFLVKTDTIPKKG